jgi:hypothetical protein
VVLAVVVDLKAGVDIGMDLQKAFMGGSPALNSRKANNIGNPGSHDVIKSSEG